MCQYCPYVSKKKTQVVKLIASNLPSVRMHAAPENETELSRLRDIEY